MIVNASLTYERLNRIGVGQGQNSEVFLANDPQLGAQVAVKEILKAKLANTAYFAEAQIMFASSHPHVVRVLYGCETPDRIGIVMPYYAKGSLVSRIATAPVSLGESIRIGLAVANGLRHIHTKGFLHLDVKPSNVMFDDRDEPLVTDFGQSRTVGPTGVVTAPPMYMWTMPPEVHTTAVADARADVYHVGVLLYRMVNGEPLYQAQLPALGPALVAATTAGRFPDRTRFLPHVPQRLRGVIRRALAIDPLQRHATANALEADLSAQPLTDNWLVAVPSPGVTTWTAQRAGAATMIVELAPDGSQTSKTSVWTESGGARRARNRAAYWRNGLSATAADKHLRRVFRDLSGA